MVSLSIFTTMTDMKKKRWRSTGLLQFLQMIIVVGDDWPNEFSWDTLVKLFRKDNKCTSDWCENGHRLFLHEETKVNFNALEKYNNYPQFRYISNFYTR